MVELVEAHTDTGPTELAWLHRLVGEWQLIADLSFADLVLWVPLRTADGFIAVAQLRPTTGPTAYHDDLVGQVVANARRPALREALTSGRIVRVSEPLSVAGSPVVQEVVPVRHGSRVVAVVGRDSKASGGRDGSQLEQVYQRTADDLAQMVAEGRFPFPAAFMVTDGGPRVGDGMVRLDASGRVEYASPNAQSAYRRLGFTGDLLGQRLAPLTSQLAASAEAVEEPVGVLATGRVSRVGDVEAPAATVQMRAIPLTPGGRHVGAVVLLHDVTELRRRERQLMTKDATIREIHHRVKNNLQTVAALLRLQSRRVGSAPAREALEESVRRISSIAVVHETLSASLEETVAFDRVADRLLHMVADVTVSERPVRVARLGSFGTLGAAVATPLAMVLTELLQNAVQHGLAATGGEVAVEVERDGGVLSVRVRDDGAGLPVGFDLAGSDRLGLQIVRTLVTGELAGALQVSQSPAGRGTVAAVRVPLPGGR